MMVYLVEAEYSRSNKKLKIILAVSGEHFPRPLQRICVKPDCLLLHRMRIIIHANRRSEGHSANSCTKEGTMWEKIPHYANRTSKCTLNFIKERRTAAVG